MQAIARAPAGVSRTVRRAVIDDDDLESGRRRALLGEAVENPVE